MKDRRTQIACKVINAGIRMLPERYRTQQFISNAMKTGHIKAASMAERRETVASHRFGDHQ